MVTPYVFTYDTERIRACVVAAQTRQHAEGCVKVWEDLDRYRAVIALTRPTLVIECGTHTGASASWFAERVPHVITLDLHDRVDRALPDNVTAITGRSSTDDSVVTDVTTRSRRFARVMVVLDSDHSAAHVSAEIAAYGPLVTPGCHLVVEDGIARWMPGENVHGSPYDAIEHLLVDNPDWSHDTIMRDRHPITMYPDGWWMRNARGSV